MRDGSSLLQPPPKTTQTILGNVHSPEDLDVLVFDVATDDQLKPPNVAPQTEDPPCPGYPPVNSGLNNTFVPALALDPTAPQTLYAGTFSSGVFKSTDGAGSWTVMNPGWSTTDVFALAIDPTAPQTLYVGADPTGVFKSTDGGGSWMAMNNGLPKPSTRVRALTLHPTEPIRRLRNLVVAALDSELFDPAA